jgi:hypothetical protein
LIRHINIGWWCPASLQSGPSRHPRIHARPGLPTPAVLHERGYRVGTTGQQSLKDKFLKKRMSVWVEVPALPLDADCTPAPLAAPELASRTTSPGIIVTLRATVSGGAISRSSTVEGARRKSLAWLTRCSPKGGYDSAHDFFVAERRSSLLGRGALVVMTKAPLFSRRGDGPTMPSGPSRGRRA